MLTLQAGELDQQITFQERAAGTDTRGQANGAWANVAALTNIWSKADTRPGQDFFGDGQEHATSTVTFRIRYRTTVHERMRVVWKGQTFEIVGRPINVKGANVALDVQCVAGTGDGR